MPAPPLNGFFLTSLRIIGYLPILGKCYVFSEPIALSFYIRKAALPLLKGDRLLFFIKKSPIAGDGAFFALVRQAQLSRILSTSSLSTSVM
jgi:hypothetical protein